MCVCACQYTPWTVKCTLQVEQQAVNGKVLLPGYNEEGLLTLHKCEQGLLTLTG